MEGRHQAGRVRRKLGGGQRFLVEHIVGRTRSADCCELHQQHQEPLAVHFRGSQVQMSAEVPTAAGGEGAAAEAEAAEEVELSFDPVRGKQSYSHL